MIESSAGVREKKVEKEKVVERDMTRVEKSRRRQGARPGPEVVMEVSKSAKLCFHGKEKDVV